MNMREYEILEKYQELEDAFFLETDPDESKESKNLWKQIQKGRKAAVKAQRQVNYAFRDFWDNLQKITEFIEDIIDILN